jgi:hypothetical protein
MLCLCQTQSAQSFSLSLLMGLERCFVMLAACLEPSFVTLPRTGQKLLGCARHWGPKDSWVRRLLGDRKRTGRKRRPWCSFLERLGFAGPLCCHCCLALSGRMSLRVPFCLALHLNQHACEPTVSAHRVYAPLPGDFARQKRAARKTGLRSASWAGSQSV